MVDMVFGTECIREPSRLPSASRNNFSGLYLVLVGLFMHEDLLTRTQCRRSRLRFSIASMQATSNCRSSVPRPFWHISNPKDPRGLCAGVPNTPQGRFRVSGPCHFGIFKPTSRVIRGLYKARGYVGQVTPKGPSI